MAWVWKGRSSGANRIPLSWGPTGTCTTSPSKVAATAVTNATTLKNFVTDNGLGLLTQLRGSHQLGLVSQLVRANVGEFAPCHKEWLIPYPNKKLEAKVCTTWLCSLLWAKLLKTSSMTPTFNYRSGWGTLSHSTQKRWVTSCIFNKRSGNQRQRNLCKPSSKKSMNTWTATIGHWKIDAKFLRMSK